MRIVLLFLFTILLGNIQAQSTLGAINLEPRNVIKTNPMAMIIGPIVFSSEYRIAIENVTSRNQSVQIGISYLGQNSILKSQYEGDTLYTQYGISLILRGYRAQLSYRFYINDDAPNGLYFAPHLSYSSAKVFQKQNNYIYKDEYFKFTYVNFAGMVGYQILANKTIALDMFFGMGYKSNNFDLFEKNQFKAQDKEGLYMFGENFKMYLGFNLGYAF